MTQRSSLVCAAVLVSAMTSASACRRTETSPAAQEPQTLSVSHWTDRTELFMEHSPLIAGATARLAVHVTLLSDFRALNEGHPSVELKDMTGRVTILPGSAPLRPGAFRVEGQMPPAGQYSWGVRVKANGLDDFHDLGPITVFASDQAARSAPGPAEGPLTIAYLKEQQWVTDFATEAVRAEGVRTSVRATATVVVTAGGEAAVVSPSAGRLVAPSLPQIGDRVSQGSLLARYEPRIASLEERTVLQQNVEEAGASVEAAEVEHQRAGRLLAERAIPARRVEEATRALTIARSRLRASQARLEQRDETLRSGGAGVGSNTFDLRAPIAGTIVAVTATPGAAYEAGVELFRIVRTQPVVIEAHLPASQGALRDTIDGLAIEVPGRAEPLTLRILRQRQAGVIDQRTRSVVLRFDVDNRDGRLLVGQVGTALLMTRDRTTVPVVPPAAILTEAGQPYVFVQLGGESFERRVIRLGGRDNGRVAVVAGLKAGDRVVTRGSYDIQLASAAKGLPAEGHVH